jgi:hypothetical protein
MANQISLDDLIRNLKETAAIGDEQLQSTMRGAINFIVTLANNAYERHKPSIEISQRAKGTLQVTAELDSITGREYADISVTKKKTILESAATLTKPNIEEGVQTARREEADLSLNRASTETIYSFNNRSNGGARFKQGITGIEAQAILDLISGSEGSRINNGENLLITSDGKKLFETDGAGKIIYAANDRDRRFKTNRNIPIVNSITDLQQRATSIVRNEQSLRDELEVVKTTGREYPDRQFERVAKTSSMARSPAQISSSEANQEQVADLVYIKKRLIGTGIANHSQPEELTMNDGTTLKAQQSKGIVQIEMYEVDAPKPVILGKIDEQGNVFLSQEYTAPRYTAVHQFIKNQELATTAPGKAPITAPVITVNNQPDRKSPTAPLQGVSLQELIDLKSYYLKSPTGKSQPQSVNAEANFKHYKSQISTDGKTVTGNQDLKMTNEFFDTFKSTAVQLSPEDRSNLEAANQFAIAQTQLAREIEAQAKPPIKQRSQTKGVVI